MSKSYRELDIYKLAHKLAVEIHKMTIFELPTTEKFEAAPQIRRASKSISTNIVEGFARRRYKAEYVRFLIYSHASCDESMEHLLFLRDTNSLGDARSSYFIENYESLSKKIYTFIQSVERFHNT